MALSAPIEYTVTAAGAGQPIDGTRHPEGTTLKRNPDFSKFYVHQGWLKEPTKRGRKPAQTSEA